MFFFPILQCSWGGDYPSVNKFWQLIKYDWRENKTSLYVFGYLFKPCIEICWFENIFLIKIFWQFFFEKVIEVAIEYFQKNCNGEIFHPKKEGSILSNFMQHNGTCIKTSKLSNLNKAWKWLLIAFCFENVFFTNCNDTQKKFFLASFKPWANRTYIGLITSTWVSKSTNQK